MTTMPKTPYSIAVAHRILHQHNRGSIKKIRVRGFSPTDGSWKHRKFLGFVALVHVFTGSYLSIFDT